ncbi:MAG: fibronectin type III domain-containing protein, partial [Candidatus Kerfeldbacteria bacterium]|nr:fibronectin type III domain-containing protein [Candidatus Kerfeldbacteria bacterium]
MKMISNGMAIIGMLFILVWVMPASADSYTLPFIEFDPGAYSWESNRSGYISQPGSQLSVVGLISRMYCPLPEPPYGPEREYTLYLTGIADGTTVTPIGFVTNYETDYSNVEFFVYEDNTPDAPSLSAMPTNPPNAAVPNAFTDGALILSGTGSFSIGTSVLTLPTITIVTGGFGGNFAVTGGLRFCIVGAVAGYMQGSLDPRQSYLPAGYSGKLDGRFVGSYDYPTVSPPPCYLISVFPACAQRGIVFYEPGRGFTPDAYVELHFIKPDGTPDLPNPIEHTDACGRFQHLYNSSTASQYGVYQYYAVDLATGRQSGTVQFKILSPNQADRPVPPTNVQIENPGTGTTLKLSWSPSTSQFVERYRVYRWQTGSPVTLAGTPTTTSFEDQGLIRGQEYYYAVSAADCVGEGLLSGAVPGTPQYYPVVLVHGICSDADMWNQLKPYLEQQGYAVHTVNLVPNDERPHIVTSILEQKIQEVAGDEPVSIVAHSMGGLVARIASKNLYEMTGRSWIR